MYVHAQDGCTASDVQHDLVLEQVRVVVYRVSVGLCADFVFQHLLVDAVVVVAVEVVRFAVRHAGHGVISECCVGGHDCGVDGMESECRDVVVVAGLSLPLKIYSSKSGLILAGP